jgi:hypothetical protein
MKTILLILSFIIFDFYLTSASNSTNETKLDSSFINFKDINNALSFFNRNDSLFCKTAKGVMYYDRINDKWLIEKLDSEFIPKIISHPHENLPFPIGYLHSDYAGVKKIRNNWTLAYLADAELINNEVILDTLKRIVYRFPYEGINDFLFEDSIMWVASHNGIFKINMESLSRIDYLLLPAFNHLTSIHETANAIFYLDFDYGLFEYNKQTKCILPNTGINQNVIENNYKFSRSFLEGDKLFVLGAPMEKCSRFLQGNSNLFIYNLVTHEIKKIDTNTYYLDAFLQFEDYLICYGVWLEEGEGGDRYYPGGAIAYNLKNDKVIEVTKTPIVSLSEIFNVLEAINIEEHDEYVIYEKYLLFTENSDSFGIKKIQNDSIYRRFYPNFKDGNVMFGGRKVFSDQKRYDYIRELYTPLDNQRKAISDSIVKNLLVKPTMIKLINKNIELDKY